MMDFVSWDDDIPNIWKVIEFHGSSHHQPVLVDPTDPTDARLDSNHWQFCRLLAKNHGAEAAEGGCVDIESIGKAVFTHASNIISVDDLPQKTGPLLMVGQQGFPS